MPASPENPPAAAAAGGFRSPNRKVRPMTHAPLRKPVTPALRDVFSAVAESGPAAAQPAITQNAVPGDTLTVTLADAGRNDDPGTPQQVGVRVENLTSGESEALDLTETAANSGVFAGSLDTVRAAGAGSDDDGVVQALAGYTLRVTYEQPDPAGTRTAETVLQGTLAEIAMSPTPAPGDTLALTVTDPDADTDAASPQQVAVTVVNATTGESETVTLDETGNATGAFTGTLATADAAGAGSDDDGTLNVQGGDTLTASYVDTAPAGVRVAEVDVIQPSQIEFIADTAIAGANGGTYSILLPSNCRTLIVLAFGSDGPAYPAFSSIKYNSKPLTKVVGYSANTNQGNNAGCEAWLIQNPDVDAAYALSVSWSGGFIANRFRLFSVNSLVAVGGVGGNAENAAGQTSNTLELTVTTANSMLLTALAAEDNFLDGAAPTTSGINYSVQNRTTTGISDLCINSAFANDVGISGLKTISWSFAPGGSSVDGSASIALELVATG
jgi:hypothetical protein